MRYAYLQQRVAAAKNLACGILSHVTLNSIAWMNNK